MRDAGMFYLKATALVGLVAVWACSGPAQGSTTLLPDGLVGREYRSLEEREVGLGPEGANGVVMGHWHLTFTSAIAVEWHYSDVFETSAYALAPEGALHPSGFLLSAPSARYDADTDRILWDELWYERVE